MAEQKSSIQVIEKRRFLRLNDYFKVTFQPATDFNDKKTTGASEIGWSKNLSLGGIAFVTSSPVAQGDYVRASIQIPELADPIDVVGQVIRVASLGGGKHELALKFLPFGMDEDQRNKLELFIYDHFLTDPLV